MKKLIIHIGVHKTGTTSFQRLLRANQKHMIENNVRPIFELDRNRARRFNLFDLSHLHLRACLKTGARLRGQISELQEHEKATFEDSFAKAVNTHPEDTLIASAEVFCFMREETEKEKLSAFFAKLDRKVEILLVLRDLTSWKQSWENQLQKDPKVAPLLNSFPEEERINADWYYDTESILNFWQDLGKVHKFQYEDHDDICEPLVNFLGFTMQELRDVERLNKRKNLDAPTDIQSR
ncbi:hypothetical protein SAMN04488056_11387 [Cohaesibacter marisflavi]|uniref:Sulfotransferase family protein n=1 Tax=Cohaesibacter marisflavi TaxID=655353 RepID=A0A1I5K8V0_9HYPH|nr:hypothetical protein [Cohaesibacter marisflavi]SFO81437.1 hypothetical protein SAMN04488056_11387 [Cohaesibacter marisflavi]